MQDKVNSSKIAILSDIHGNSPALEAVLADVHGEGCSWIYVLGDIVNGVDPKGCIGLLIDLDNAAYVKGNAEHYLLTPDLDHFPKEKDPKAADVIELVKWWQRQIPKDYILFLRNMPDFLISDESCFLHDSPMDRFFPETRLKKGIPQKYQEFCHHAKGISPNITNSEIDEIAAFLDSRQLSRLFCGHTHIPLQKEIDGKLICNVGSVGLPLDGDPRACWMMLNDTALGSLVAIRRVEYDIDKTISLIDRPGIPRDKFDERYKQMLKKGIPWRSL